MVVCIPTAEVCVFVRCGAGCGCASLFSMCREGHRRWGEFLIGMDPQTHIPTPSPTLSPSWPQATAASPQCEGTPTGTPAPASPLSKGTSRVREGRGAMDPLTSVGPCWLSIGSQARSGVPVGLFHRACHSCGLGSIPSCGTWLRGTRGC